MKRSVPLERLASCVLLALTIDAVGCSSTPSAGAEAGADASLVDAPTEDANVSPDVAADSAIGMDAPTVIDAPTDAPAADAPTDAPAVDAPVDVIALIDVQADGVEVAPLVDVTVVADLGTDANPTADADAPTGAAADAPDVAPGCRSDADCDASTRYCRADMRCVSRECVPASARCAAGGTREVCDARGIGYSTMPCASSESCRDGVCLPRACVPGSVRCAATSLTVVETCAPDGLGYSSTDCAPGQSCRGGACFPQVCAPGALRCASASAVEQCNGDGLGYAAPTSCPSMSGCNPATNMCAAWACAPGTRSCDGNSTRVCNADGLGHTTSACGARQTCSAGACVDWTCTPSSRSCASADVSRQCNADGLGYTPTPCAAMTGCVDATGACTPWACVPGTVTGCRDSARAVCAANGHGDGLAPCPTAPHAAAACNAGTCGLACDAGYGDCDNVAVNGCEVALTTTAHCGACGRACSPGHATAACTAGACAIGTCDAGYGDCDGVAANGCETDLRSTAAHCGRCGNACAAGVACRAFACGGPAGADFAVSQQHGCARHSTGAVSCWGDGFYGRLGDGTQMASLTPVPVLGLTDATRLSSCHLHTCALRAGGAVVCWGRNANGGLGHGASGGYSAVPVTVLGLGDAVDIAAGADFSCALREAGSISCWGANTYGQLGNNSLVDANTPVPVADLSDATGVSAGARHACARRASGAVVCWGDNADGELGNGTTVSSRVPVTVTGLTDALEVSVGALYTCALRASGSVVCWGRNDYGQVGNGSVGADVLTPVAVVGLSDATQVSAGTYHACARRASGAVFCWGSNGRGSLGDGMATSSARSAAVVGLTEAVRVVVGTTSSCARRAGGEVVCWGDNTSAQLSGRTNPVLVPTAVPGFP